MEESAFTFNRTNTIQNIVIEYIPSACSAVNKKKLSIASLEVLVICQVSDRFNHKLLGYSKLIKGIPNGISKY